MMMLLTMAAALALGQTRDIWADVRAKAKLQSDPNTPMVVMHVTRRVVQPCGEAHVSLRGVTGCKPVEHVVEEIRKVDPNSPDCDPSAVEAAARWTCVRKAPLPPAAAYAGTGGAPARATGDPHAFVRFAGGLYRLVEAQTHVDPVYGDQLVAVMEVRNPGPSPLAVDAERIVIAFDSDGVGTSTPHQAQVDAFPDVAPGGTARVRYTVSLDHDRSRLSMLALITTYGDWRHAAPEGDGDAVTFDLSGLVDRDRVVPPPPAAAAADGFVHVAPTLAVRADLVRANAFHGSELFYTLRNDTSGYRPINAAVWWNGDTGSAVQGVAERTVAPVRGRNPETRDLWIAPHATARLRAFFRYNTVHAPLRAHLEADTAAVAVPLGGMPAPVGGVASTAQGAVAGVVEPVW